MIMSQLCQLVDNTIHGRQQAVVQALAEHQGMGQVVDVFRGAGKVNKFGHGVQFRNAGNFFLDEVLDRFHIVIGGAFDVLDALGVLKAELTDQTVQNFVGFGGKLGYLSYSGMSGQLLQPADLDGYPVPDQAIFTENFTEDADLAAIASIDRGNGGQGGEFHRKPLKSSKIRIKRK